MKKLLLSVLILIAFVFSVTLATPLTASPPKKKLPAKCGGVQRWNVKTCNDSNADVLLKDADTLKKSRKATIEKLIDFEYPFQNIKSLPKDADTRRIAPAETTIWQVTATLTSYKRESDDKDYHLVIEDEDGNTMVAEIPDPDCVLASPVFKNAIAKARADFDSRFTVTGKFQDTSTKVRITGVGMFDNIHGGKHGQNGVADNGIELHPVLKIEFP